MKVSISQPRYLPAINYLQRIYHSDCFVFLDNVQRQDRGWENRNKLLCNGNPKWITIPISSSSRADISETQIEGDDWIQNHVQTIHNYYIHHEEYEKRVLEKYYDGIENELYAQDYLFAPVIAKSIENIFEILDLEINYDFATNLSSDRINKLTGPEKLYEISNKANASTYISGPNGKEYGVNEVFAGTDIDVVYHEFDHPTYQQKDNSEFVPYMGFFDVIFNKGVDYLRQIVKTNPNLIDSKNY